MSGASPKDVLAQLERTGSCARPIRIVVTREGHPEEDRVMLLPCKDRRAALCPACAHTYKGDAWQVVASGIQGGKGVTTGVGSRPMVFATLTAPSFGPVHSNVHGRHRACRQGRNPTCPHGRPASCAVVHDDGDPLLGQPLCPACFDYPGAVLWNAHVAVLWQRTAKRLLRSLEHCGGERKRLRLSYVKVAEFQRRGLVHLHVVVRVDGDGGQDDPPPAWLTGETLAGALCDVVPHVATGRPPTRVDDGDDLVWGRQLAVSVIDGGSSEEDRRLAVAAYVAKYATKTADSTGALAQRIRRRSEIADLAVNDHQRRLVETAWKLGCVPELEALHLRRCAHAFGFRGHVVTKSTRYSTTFSALRGARADYRRKTGSPEHDLPEDAHVGFAGRGYDDPGLGLLAFHLAQLATRPADRHERPGRDR